MVVSTILVSIGDMVIFDGVNIFSHPQSKVTINKIAASRFISCVFVWLIVQSMFEVEASQLDIKTIYILNNTTDLSDYFAKLPYISHI